MPPEEQTKLLPCPFCGWEHPQIIDDELTKNKEQTHISWWGYCTRCSAEGQWADTKPQAVIYWNTRTQPTLPTAEEIRRIAEKCALTIRKMGGGPAETSWNGYSMLQCEDYIQHAINSALALVK